MLCSNKQMVLASDWKRFFEKDSNVVFLRYYSSSVTLITLPSDKYCREHGYQPCNKQGQPYLETVRCSP